MPSINERARVGAVRNTATVTLRELASDRSPKVRQAVAKNPSTPSDVLSALVRDEKSAVRFAVAENPSPHALPVALAASDADVRGRAAQRIDLDLVSAQLVLRDPVHTVRERMAEVTQDASVLTALAPGPSSGGSFDGSSQSDANCGRCRDAVGRSDRSSARNGSWVSKTPTRDPEPYGG